LNVEVMPFIVMELAQGETLDQRGAGTLAETLGFARQICAALDHAHNHGIIHRDLKPKTVISRMERPNSWISAWRARSPATMWSPY
jgi:serine/threonine protein kinase